MRRSTQSKKSRSSRPRGSSRRKNLFGLSFGKKVTHSPTLLNDAYAAGRRTGDTDRATAWIASQEKKDKFTGSFRKSLRERYRAGVLSLWDDEKKKQKVESHEEHMRKLQKEGEERRRLEAVRKRQQEELKEAKKAKVAEKREAKKTEVKRSKTVKQDVTQRLRDEGMYHAGTSGIVKRLFRKGDTVDALYRKAVARNRKNSTEDRERQMTRLAKIAAEMRRLHDASPSTREKELRAKFPNTPRERILRMIAAERVPNPNAAIMRQGNATATITRPGLMKWKVQVVAPGYRVIEETFNSSKGAVAWARLKLHDVAANPRDIGTDLVPGASTVGAYVEAGHRIVKGVSGAAKTGLKRLKKLTRRNPLELAQRRHEEFTGFPSTETLEIMQRQHIHTNLVGLAQFVAFNIIGVDGKEIPPIQAPGMKYVGGPREEVYFSFKGKPKGDWQFEPRTPAQKIVWLTSSEHHDRDAGGNVKVKQQLFLSGGDQGFDADELKYLGLTDRDIHDNTLIGTIVRVWYWTRKTFERDGKEKVWFYHDFGKEGSDGVCPVLVYHPLNPSLEIAGGRYYIDLPKKSLGGVSAGIVG